jgi:hypothetical protein
MLPRNGFAKRGLWALLLLAVVAALLIFFEWMGSEQAVKQVEKQLDLPAQPKPDRQADGN